jgi:hypothetical protein
MSDPKASPAAIQPPWHEVEPLWVAALGVALVVGGYRLFPSMIHMLGHAGQAETVEWADYLFVLLAFPVVAAVIAYSVPRHLDRRLDVLAKGGLLFLLAALAIGYVVRSRWPSIAAATAMSVITVVLLTVRRAPGGTRVSSLPAIARASALLFVGAAAWMSAGALVSWADATAWLTARPGRFGLFALTAALTILALRTDPGLEEEQPFSGVLSRSLLILGVGILAALSFRTNPVLELYHWEAYVGPMQGLRQGGWLLWDTPAQYGLLSILIPTVFPGNAWQSFYLFQGICNFIVALLMFRALLGLRPSVSRFVVAIAVTATTLFFRPRSAELLLSGQMTPSGGPVRFIWCFVMLAFLFSSYRRSQAQPAASPRAETNFALWGNLIWLASFLWSVEAAIYTSAIWFPAYGFHLLQRASREKRSGIARGARARGALLSVVWPFAALAAMALVISAFYRLMLGHFPDWMGYVEYALLYSGGFHALPIDPSGSVWFLLVVFFAVSTALVIYFSADPSDPRLIVLSGAWGGVWAISSYFVSRSHPANLLSIATFLVFAAAITLSVFEMGPSEAWHDFVRVALVPIFAVPIVLTVGHPGFLQQITTPQLSYGSFTEQIPLMEPSLSALLVQAGARPADPVVRIGDGRLVLPAWPVADGRRTRVVSPYSWLPKQYEIIGTLPVYRRLTYIDRSARDLRLSGWLIHAKKASVPDFSPQIAEISRTHTETKRFENNDWTVSWYEIKQDGRR